MKEKTKVFQLAGKAWRIDKVNALEGSNLLRMFTSAGNTNPQEFLAGMPSEQFQRIQIMLLTSAFRVENIDGQDTYSPVLLPNGIVDKEAEDSGVLFMLTVIALMFNMSGFFAENTLKEFQEVVKEFNV